MISFKDLRCEKRRQTDGQTEKEREGKKIQKGGDEESKDRSEIPGHAVEFRRSTCGLEGDNV